MYVMIILLLLIISFAIIFAQVFTLKDIFTRNIDMNDKIFWAFIILMFSIIGVAVYYLAKYLGVHKESESVQDANMTEGKSGLSNIKQFIYILLFFGIITLITFLIITSDAFMGFLISLS